MFRTLTVVFVVIFTTQVWAHLEKSTTPNVGTVCYNPSFTKIGECIESLDTQVVEKCIPGLSKVLKNLEEKPSGIYLRETNQSEVCLRQVFGRCTYDSRYRIKTKIKTEIGINLDIAFQDDFEMDCCNETTINVMVSNIEDCHKKQLEEMKSIPNASAVFHLSAAILSSSVNCIADHTTFSCVFYNQTLFKITVEKLLTYMKNYGLAALDKISNPNKNNDSRLCFKSLDYFRMEHCEKQLFDYINCTKDGLTNPHLLEQVVKCFTDSFRFCPYVTLQTLFTIIVGAIRPSVEPIMPFPSRYIKPGIDLTPRPSELKTTASPCNYQLLNKWGEKIKLCAISLLRPQKNGEWEKVAETVLVCIEKIKPPDCSYHKYSQFKKVSRMMIYILKETAAKVFSHGEPKYPFCSFALSSPFMEECNVKFFLYYVSLHQAHHTKESLQKQFAKVKLCLEVTLNKCPFKVIPSLLQMLGIFFGIEVSVVSPAQIVTKVTAPEGNIWCETRTFTDSMPLPTTKKEVYLEEKTIKEVKKPTTVKQSNFTVTSKSWHKTFIPPFIQTIIIRWPEVEYTEFKVPTTVKDVEMTIKRTDLKKTKSQPTTTELHYTLKSNVVTDHETPTTVTSKIRTPEMRDLENGRTLPFTKIKTWRPKLEIFTERITPTTIKVQTRTAPSKTKVNVWRPPTTKIWTHKPSRKPHTEIITPTTVEQKHFRPPTTRETHFVPPPVTEIYKFTVNPRTKPGKITPTTVKATVFEVPSVKRTYFIHPPVTRYEIITPPSRTIVESITPTTSELQKFTITEKFHLDCEKETTMQINVHGPEGETKTETEKLTTKKEIFTVKPTKYEEYETPTTVNVKVVTIPSVTAEVRNNVPGTRTKYYTPPARSFQVNQTPTSVKEIEIKIPEKEKRQTKPPPFIWTVKYNPTVETVKNIITPTTLQTTRLPVTEERFADHRTETTIQILIVEFMTNGMVESEPYTTTQKIYTLSRRTFEGKMTPTTIRTEHIPFTTKMEQKTARLPPTRFFLSNKLYSIVDHATPTTVKNIILPATSKVEHKTKPQPITIIIRHFPSSEKFTDKVTPTTAKKFEIPLKSESIPEHATATTSKLKVLEEEVVETFETQTLPSTKLQIFGEEKTHFEKATPSTKVQIIISPTPKIEVEGKKTPPTESYITFYSKIFTERITPTTIKKLEVPLTWGFKPKIFPEATTKSIIQTPVSKKYPEHQTPTPVTYVSFPIDRIADTEKEYGLTIKMYFIEKYKGETISKTRKVPPTRFTWYWKVVTAKEHKETPTTKTVVILVTPQVASKTRYIGTKIFNFTLPEKFYKQSVTPTTTEMFTVPAKEIPLHEKRSHPHTEEYFFFICNTHHKEKLTPTTSILKPVTQPVLTFTEEKHDTTIGGEVIEFEVVEKEKGKPPPPTREITWQPLKVPFVEIITPTTHRTREVTPPVEKVVNVEPLRPTRRITFAKPKPPYIEVITPTTMKEIEFTLQRTKIHDEVKPATTKMPIYIPTTHTHKERKTPKTTKMIRYTAGTKKVSEHRDTPSTKTIRITAQFRVRETVGEIPPTEKVKIPPTTKKYTCIYPKRTTVKCHKVPRPKEICTPQRLRKWHSKIENCITRVMNDRKKVIKELDNSSMQELKEVVKQCIKDVGDTTCRNNSFNLVKWIQEKEIMVVGQYGEHHAESADFSDQQSFHLKECITVMDEDKLKKCLPGLDNVLNSIVLHGKPIIPLQILPSGDYSCLAEIFKHCNLSARQELEKILHNIFLTCIKLTSSKEKSSCNETNTGSKYCAISHAQDFTGRLNSCVRSAGGLRRETSVSESFYIISTCAQHANNEDCFYGSWDSLKHILDYIFGTVAKNSEGNAKCMKRLVVHNIKNCVQSHLLMVKNMKYMEKAARDKAMGPVAKCYASTLKECPPDIKKHFVTIMASITNSEDLPDSQFASPYIESDIGSIKIQGDSINVCETITSVTPPGPIVGAALEDECIPVYSGEGDSKPKYFLQKVCDQRTVESWMYSLKNCVHRKSTEIGLQNISGLTVSRVITIIKKCSQHVKNCRLKYQEHFRSVLHSLLKMVQHFSLSTEKNGCHNAMVINNIIKCLNSLHRYLVLAFEPSDVQRAKVTSVKCMQKYLNRCPNSGIQDIVEMLGQSIRQNVEYYKKHYGNRDSSCESDIPSTPPGILSAEKDAKCVIAPLFSLAYPDLIKLKKKFDSKHSVISPPRRSRAARDIRVTVDCSPIDYIHYFEKIIDCGKLRLHLKSQNENGKCLFHEENIKWTAMAQCLMENKNYKLLCDINHVSQMNDFLKEVSSTLKKTWMTKENCSHIECYKKDGTSLHKCADLYYHLYVSQRDSVEMSSEILSKQLLHVFNCLKTVWPACHAGYSLLSIPFVHIPLGINLNLMIKKTPEKNCLYVKYPQIGNDLKCKEYDNKAAFDAIAGCLQEFIINLTKEHSFNSAYKLHWNVDPLNTCIMNHRIINCTQTQFHNFSVLVKDIVKNVTIQINKYYNLFDDLPDLRKGQPCLIELSSSVESCLFHLYEYKTNFDVSQIKKSFHGQCLDDIFEGCYLKSTMHILIKKLLNVVDEHVNSTKQKFQSIEICMENQPLNPAGFSWAPCPTKNPGTYLSDLDHCMERESVNQLVPSIARNSSTLRTYEFCKKCLKMEYPCVFENNNDLMQFASLTIQCLRSHDIEGHCIMDADEKIKKVCSPDLYICSQQIKSDTIMKALDACREFYSCITQFVRKCSKNTSETISKVYFHMLGLDFLPSIYKKSRLQELT